MLGSLKGWCIPIEGLTVQQIRETYTAKIKQLDEMNQQFKAGEEADEGVGLIRVGKNLEDRVGSWPPWLWEILSRRLSFDPINKQFFIKHPDDRKLMATNAWLHRVKLHPLKYFAMKYPLTAMRNIFRLDNLRKTLLNDTRYFDVSAIDQPEKGEDGYYHFHDNSFWEGEGA
jgi:hypothetical protein